MLSLRTVPLVFLLVGTSGCAGLRPVGPAPATTTTAWPAPDAVPTSEAATTDDVAEVGASTPAVHLEDHLREHMSDWMGVAYRYGGTSRQGIDCSAFVQRIYGEALGLSLPRTTVQQMQEGYTVSQEALQAGDLVFFRTGKKSHHVGIYLRGGQFAHAGQSTGVTVSNLSEGYWTRTYRMARRLVEPAWFAESALLPEDDNAPDSAPAGPARRVVGW